MFHAIVLSAALAALWGMLSGHNDLYLLSLGGLSILATVWIIDRLDILDDEAVPFRLLPRAIVYWPWLVWEIIKANGSVAKIILTPRLPISPTMIRVSPRQTTDLGRAVYANSITLTPGTLSVDMTSTTLTVHALTRRAADDVTEGTMERKVCWLENGS